MQQHEENQAKRGTFLFAYNAYIQHLEKGRRQNEQGDHTASEAFVEAECIRLRLGDALGEYRAHLRQKILAAMDELGLEARNPQDAPLFYQNNYNLLAEERERVSGMLKSYKDSQHLGPQFSLADRISSLVEIFHDLDRWGMVAALQLEEPRREDYILVLGSGLQSMRMPEE